MSGLHSDPGAHPSTGTAAGDATPQQTHHPNMAVAPAPAEVPDVLADAQVATLIRTLARIIRRQCTVPTDAEERKEW